MGKLITIDGIDGSGKSTQCGLLYEELRSQDKNVRLISFPMYGTVGATFVDLYLQGRLGDKPGDTNAYAAATFFAMDRYYSYVTDWKEFYEQPDSIVIASRYSTSNAIHQLSKLDRDDWDEFLTWIDKYEHDQLGLPRADLVMYLEMKPEISLELVNQREDATGQKKDIHEKDADYINRCYHAAMYSCDRLGWERVICHDGKNPLSIDDIHAKVLENVTRMLDVGGGENE